MTAAFPAPWIEFLHLFNGERFWEAHEVLEGPWRENRSPFYKGMIIYASAFVHVQRGNPAGVAKQMAKVEKYLPPYRPFYLGLDVQQVLRYAGICRQRVKGREEALRGQEAALRRLIPFPKLDLDVRRCRGDEPERLDDKAFRGRGREGAFPHGSRRSEEGDHPHA